MANKGQFTVIDIYLFIEGVQNKTGRQTKTDILIILQI